MKKVLALILTIAMVFCCAAFAEGGGEGKSIMMALNALGDLSINDLLYKGLLETQEKFGYDVSYAEVGTDISTYEGYFFDFCDEGYDYAFLRSGFLDICREYAQDYPEMNFIVYDTTPLDTCEAGNVYMNASTTYQAAYLVGMAAAGTTETGVIGFIGGQENPLIYDFLVGYIQGAKAQNPDIKVVNAFVGNYNDTAKSLELASAQITSSNADVIFAACGAASLGVFQACLQNGKHAIGCDSDQYAAYNTNGETELASVIITSCLKNMDQAIVQIMSEVTEGKDIFAQVESTALGLAENAVGIADNENYRAHVSEEVRAQIEEAKEAIIAGDVVVKSAYFMTQEEIDALLASVAK